MHLYRIILVPAAAHYIGVGSVETEPHTGHTVTVTLVNDGVLALSQSVPLIDGLFLVGKYDLPVVSTEGHAQLSLLVFAAGLVWFSLTVSSCPFPRATLDQSKYSVIRH